MNGDAIDLQGWETWNWQVVASTSGYVWQDGAWMERQQKACVARTAQGFCMLVMVESANGMRLAPGRPGPTGPYPTFLAAAIEAWRAVGMDTAALLPMLRLLVGQATAGFAPAG